MLLPVLLVSLLCCSCFLAESKFWIEEIYRSYNDVSLTCKTNTGSYEQNLQWWFNKTPLAESRCYKYNHIESSNGGSISVTVTPKCEGNVSCSAGMTSDNEERIPHKLLAYPVVINDTVVVVKAKEGSSVTLDCRLEISALNNTEVHWEKNSSCPISSQHQVLSNYSLVLTKVKPSHTGTYVCEGTAKHSCDDNLCTKKTFTHLEVEKFYPVANLTATCTYYNDIAVFGVLADGSLPITYQLFVEDTAQGKGISRQEKGSVQPYICISRSTIEVPNVTVVATNVDWSGHVYTCEESVVIRTQQHAEHTDQESTWALTHLCPESTTLTTEAPHSTATTPKAPHSTTTTTEAPHSTATTPKAPHSTTTTTEAPQSTATTHETPDSTTTTPKAPQSTDTTLDTPHSTTTTPEPPHSTTTTQKVPHSTTTTLKAPRSTTTTPKAPHSTTKTPETPHSTTTTPEPLHSITTTPKAPHSTTTTLDTPHSTTTTLDTPHSTTTTQETSHSTTTTPEIPYLTTTTPEPLHSITTTPKAPHSTTTTTEAPHSTTTTTDLPSYLVAMKVCGAVSGVSISLGIMGVICLIVSYKKRQPKNSEDAKLKMQVICKMEEDCKSLSSVGSHSYQCRCSNGTHFTKTSNNEVILKTSGSISEYSV